MDNLITAGELAKLASTTKRTILFYDEKGVLKPFKINSVNYRFYLERQILDYQRILLLSTLGVSLNEMKIFLRKNNDLSKLFDEKKEMIKKEIRLLEFNLRNLIKFQRNLELNGTMVDPTVKIMPPFKVYFIEKVGPYAKIGRYCEELSKMFSAKGRSFTTLAIFEDQGYRPRESRIKICAFARAGMRLKEKYKDLVREMIFKPGKVISYNYCGSGEMLSLFWKELEKYCRIKGYEQRGGTPDFEIYWKVSSNPIHQKFEICLPIK